jgi:cell division protein FtsL
MQNELHDKDEAVNPMDAVRGKGASSKKAKTGKTAQTAKPRRQNLLVQVLNGEILTRDFVLNNLTFIFFILLLLMLMVAKGYYGKQLQKDINDLQADVDAKTAEYIENKAKLEETTARYRLVQELEPKGLKEAVNPAKVIRVKPKEDE